jgi:hypothetical protein
VPDIRLWIIENDWLEAVVALLDQLFYNADISTDFWVVARHPQLVADWRRPRAMSTHLFVRFR